ncbi:lipopolysaccharide heptosyltransferase II [Candidatus Uabimicrobium amorphum]|uniref:lipopolysaccharide heptosyltransferase II n=1 Tax=Uabimicrobium amorphum TaxID=2596890 RepID=A0A5S9IWM4_UABAM|nr:lipopolysaccharide heptosyltransferase II [Candidatus Uabimicrobium amorphum]BBM87885.1 lipopolysaccharide heptosyltransferase I [Candidatus Uabimicrobium amorphum]
MTTKKILIVKPSALGDIIHTIPIAKAIKDKYNAEISWVVSRPFKNLLEYTPVVDKIFIFERKKWGGLRFFRYFGEIVKFLRQIRAEKFDMVLDFQGLLRSGVITLLSGCKHRVGFSNARELAHLGYTQKVETPADVVHAIDRYKLIAKAIDVDDCKMTFPLNIETSLQQKWDTALPNDYAVIVPGARWSSKRWPPQYFAELINLMHEKYDIPVVLVGSPNEKQISQQVMDGINDKEKCVNTTGETSLVELAHIIKQARIVITNDSGPMHLAAALNTKTIALFGPTDPERIRPYGQQHVVMQNKGVCKCYYQKTCSSKSNLECLRTIKPDQIIPELGL